MLSCDNLNLSTIIIIDHQAYRVNLESDVSVFFLLLHPHQFERERETQLMETIAFYDILLGGSLFFLPLPLFIVHLGKRKKVEKRERESGKYFPLPLEIQFHSVY